MHIHKATWFKGLYLHLCWTDCNQTLHVYWSWSKDGGETKNFSNHANTQTRTYVRRHGSKAYISICAERIATKLCTCVAHGPKMGVNQKFFKSRKHANTHIRKATRFKGLYLHLCRTDCNQTLHVYWSWSKDGGKPKIFQITQRRTYVRRHSSKAYISTCAKRIATKLCMCIGHGPRVGENY